MNKFWVVAILSIAVAVPGFVPAQTAGRPEVLLEAAKKKEMVSGELDTAIRQYRDIVAKYPNNRAVAAEALLRMGQCYEKLGNAEAAKAYERVLREYADQKEAAVEAQKHLASRSVASASDRVERQLQFKEGELVSLSADGRYLLGIAWGKQDASLVLHDASSGQTHEFLRLKYADGDLDWAVLSPDGSKAVFGQGGELREISVQGSSLRTVVAGKEGQPIQSISPLDWSRDGKYILAEIQRSPKNFDLSVVSLPEGSVQTLKAGSSLVNYGTLGPSADYVNYGAFSPDGKHIAYSLKDKSGIFVISQDGSRETPLIRGPARNWSPLWAGNDKLLFLSDRSGTLDLWAIGVSEGKPIGEAEQIKRNVFAHQAYTTDGAYYYTNYEVQMNVYVADLDPATGRITSQPKRVNERYVGLSKGMYAWSPDGRYLTYVRKTSPYDPPSVAVVHSMLNGEERELPIRGWANPVWPADSRAIATLVQENGKTLLKRIDVQTGEVLAAQEVPAVNSPSSGLAEDGKTLFYSRIETDAQGNSSSLLIRRDIERGIEKELYRAIVHSSAGQRGGIGEISPSPDGRQIAFKFSDDDSGKSGSIPLRKIKLMSISADGGSPRVLRDYAPEGGADRMITWTKDGNNVVSVENTDAGRRIVAYPVAGGAPQPSGPLMFLIWELKVSPDGNRIAFSGAQPKTEYWVTRNLLPKIGTARK